MIDGAAIIGIPVKKEIRKDFHRHSPFPIVHSPLLHPKGNYNVRTTA